MSKVKILVSTDFSENSIHAVNAAILFAKKMDGEIVIFHVHKGIDHSHDLLIFPEFENQVHKLSSSIRSSIGTKLHEFAAKFSRSSIKITTHLYFSEDISCFSNIISEHRPELVIMSERKSEFDQFFGSTLVEHLMRSSSSPVLFLKKEITKLDEVFVPYSFQGLSNVSLEYSAKLADLFHSSLSLHHFSQNGVPRILNSLNDVKELLAPINDSSLLLIDQISDLQRDGLIKSHSFVCGSSDPKESLLVAIKDASPDLVVMASSNKNAIERFYLGSFCEYILRNSDENILITKAHI